MWAVPCASTATPTASPVVEMSTGGRPCAAAAGTRTSVATSATRRRASMRGSLSEPSPRREGLQAGGGSGQRLRLEALVLALVDRAVGEQLLGPVDLAGRPLAGRDGLDVVVELRLGGARLLHVA